MVQDNDEEIIELTQVMPEDTPETTTDDDQDIIELTDIDAGDNEKTGDEIGVDEDDGILDLGEPIPDEPEAGPETDIDPAAPAATALNDAESDQPDPEDPDSIEGDSEDMGSQSQDVITEISEEMLEAALERVIEKKFSETIEKILFEVMEKVIQKEIADIKASLQKDLDEIGNA